MLFRKLIIFTDALDFLILQASSHKLTLLLLLLSTEEPEELDDMKSGSSSTKQRNLIRPSPNEEVSHFLCPPPHTPHISEFVGEISREVLGFFHSMIFKLNSM